MLWYSWDSVPYRKFLECYVGPFTLPYCIGCWWSCCRQLVRHMSRCKRTGGDGSTSRRRAGEPPQRTSSFTTATFLRVIKLPATFLYAIKLLIYYQRATVIRIRATVLDCLCSCWTGILPPELKSFGRLNLHIEVKENCGS